MSLLASSLPRAKCKKHLAVFSASTPVGAVASYILFSFFGNNDDGWTGVALLVSVRIIIVWRMSAYARSF